MKSLSATVTGCGSSTCLCAGTAASLATVTINGIALSRDDQLPAAGSMLERAHAELLRQQAVKLGLLPRHCGLTAPELTEVERQVIDAMVEQAVVTPQPSEEACERYFEANKHLFVHGQALHVRHILFATSPAVNVHAVTLRAEGALLELSRQGVHPDRFAQLAAELSSCPTGAHGGDLGWIGPDDCAPEFANELFDQKHSRWGMGVHPRLIHTGLGFHIIEVMGRRKGRPLAYADVRERIAAALTLLARAGVRQQYVTGLARQALVEGIDLEEALSPQGE